MKKLIPIFCFILLSNLSFSQIMARKAGNYYEFNDLWQRDSLSVKLLINTYKLDISKLEYVKFFEDFDLSYKLQENYSYTTYAYMIDKNTGTVIINSIPHEQKLPAPNKYFMLYCFDDFTEKKIINIKVF